MDNLVVSIVVMLLLFVLSLVLWFGYEVYGIRKRNRNIVDKYFNLHKKKEEG